MSMSGKTFLAAFQVGSRLVPDEIDRRVSRKKINLEKDLLRIKKEVEEKKKEREKIGAESFNNFETGFNSLDLNSTDFPSKYKTLVSNNITGISMSPTAKARFADVNNTVEKNAIYKAWIDNRNNAAVAATAWNKKHPFKQITDLDNTAPEILNAADDDFAKQQQEEKDTALRSKLETEGEVKTELEDQAKFTTFLQKTGSPYKPEDFNKPEAQNAMRRNNQLEEVRDLAVEAGRDGIPIVKRLTLKKDGTGYNNVFDVKVELQEIIDKKKTDRANKGKSLSESQGNAFSYSERMRYDNRVIDQMTVKGLIPEGDTLNTLLSEWGSESKVDFFNVVVEPKYRQFKTAADNFIRAVLRKESGAAISESEYKGAFRDYIPRLGDDPATVDQKRNLRLGVTNVMRRISSIPWDDGVGIPEQPLQFSPVLGDDGKVEATAEEQAQKYFDLGYIEPGDIVEVKVKGGWQPMEFKPKPKKKP